MLYIFYLFIILNHWLNLLCTKIIRQTPKIYKTPIKYCDNASKFPVIVSMPIKIKKPPETIENKFKWRFIFLKNVIK